MKQYIVVNDFDFVSFQKKVDKLLTTGFILVGGVSAVFDQGENRMHWYQALAK